MLRTSIESREEALTSLVGHLENDPVGDLDWGGELSRLLRKMREKIPVTARQWENNSRDFEESVMIGELTEKFFLRDADKYLRLNKGEVLYAPVQRDRGHPVDFMVMDKDGKSIKIVDIKSTLGLYMESVESLDLSMPSSHITVYFSESSINPYVEKFGGETIIYLYNVFKGVIVSFRLGDIESKLCVENRRGYKVLKAPVVGEMDMIDRLELSAGFFGLIEEFNNSKQLLKAIDCSREMEDKRNKERNFFGHLEIDCDDEDLPF